MAVVDPREVVEVAVLQEWPAVHLVHDCIEDRERNDAGDGEHDALHVDERQ